ncbi:cupin-like domain-containing protein [Sphingomonas sp. NFR15]|uniref:cupin-like domain-containing protein n=1 Tax=Sphingomonas sp. NFR15 TaxID=1566282 RepID=UPI0008888DD8|nr:cupin-like domain-containing protein [Sphingomonas sp. NFR15]SDA17119.1 Cupin-like domain-containing protein [Sphingomonas sp. NFR15]
MIERDGPLDRAAFLAEIAPACAPVVLRGLCRDWPAARAAARSRQTLLACLETFDSGQVAEAFVGTAAIAGRYDYAADLDGFNFVREAMPLRDALARIDAAADAPESASVYVGSLPVERYLPGFEREHRLAALPDGAVRQHVWIGTASTVACHYDTFDNFACVVAGRRRFTLYPPDAIGDLYVGPIDFTMAGQPTSLAASAPPDDPRYPRFAAARARAITVDLEPGDALYLPKLWWHSVEATAPFNMLVNFWWDAFAIGPDAPYTAMLLAMIAIAERPERERGAWRAYFDHYVFRDRGHPLAHLPAAKHGVLGPLAQGNYGRIRAQVMKWLRGG